MLFQSAPKAFLKKLDLTAITDAERATTAEIRVAVLPRFHGSIDEY